LQAPYESGADLSQRVDRFEIRAEVVDARVVDRRAEPADVQLGQMHLAIVPRWLS
jgi:hypothetical protein